jgi:hypothetical protein
MHIYSTSGEDDSTITYSNIGKYFSGYIFFTDVNGEFINGWRYENGTITKQCKRVQSSTNVAAKALPPDQDCETVEVRWYEQDCNYYTDGSVDCTDWYYIGSTYETECTGGGGGDGGGIDEGGVDDWGYPTANWHLCGSYNFQTVGNSYTTSLTGLGAHFVHNDPPYENLDIEFKESCLSIPNYGISTATAGALFNTAFNNAVSTAMTELASGVTTSITLQNRLKTLIQANIAAAKPGATWSTALCSGNISSSTAQYCD